MSEFNQYAKQIDEIARASFKDYETAQNALKQAENQVSDIRRNYSSSDPDYAVKSARAQADYMEASKALKTAKKSLEVHDREIAGLRKALETEVSNRFVADPSAIDANTMELLRSGILKVGEYESLMNSALKTGNHTMARMIAMYAEKEAQLENKRSGNNSPSARHLRKISHMASVCTGGFILERFDFLADVYHRSSKNPSMIKMWDSLTADAVKNF